jgi:type IV pilus assembly protein PilY1
MIRNGRSILSASLGLLGLTLASSALADDLGPPTPNVLLLVDTSGSMEYKTGSTDFPQCNPGSPGDGNEKSRWIELLEVLTGSIPESKYSCNKVEREGDAWTNEFSLSGVSPYDLGYPNPYHRPLSDGCEPGPGSLDSAASAYAYPSTAFGFKDWQSDADCDFYQNPDGLLDAFKGHIRFGLMTFDSSTNEGTGVGAGNAAVASTGVEGHWSYYLGSPTTGRPPGCATLPNFEVGARNAAAPPWEGRMVAFGAPDEDPSQSERNGWIQKILLTTRPYGATPIAGQLDDARAFLWNDTSDDPLGSGSKFGPSTDPFITDGCRPNVIILLSDGEPNLDLRPECQLSGTPDGECPYEPPEQIAGKLAAGTGGPATPVFVIGFSIASVSVEGSTKNCSDFTEQDLNTYCTTDLMAGDDALKACCVLNQIAFEGDTDHAYFADNMVELRSAISAVLSKIATSATSRTLPVFGGSGGVGSSSRFFSSFVPKTFTLWRGVLERQRWECQTNSAGTGKEPKAQTIDPAKGDDFVANVNYNPGSRRFFWVEAAADNGTVQSQFSVRPSSASTDSVSELSGTQDSALTSEFPTAVSTAAMQLGSDSGVCQGMTADTCRTKLLQWLVGLDNGTDYHRCRNPGSLDCSLIGHIYHSTPRIVPAPGELLRDETYQTFAAAQAERPPVLYVSSNDGFLHAFDVSKTIDSRVNNELWSFIPPAVLPLLSSQYPPQRVDLLDGSPIVRDVVATVEGTTVKFERSSDSARSGASTWRTVLVQSFGGSQGGYFALDVTDPKVGSDGQGGPKFLWQLTTDGSGQALFGASGATPLITTLFFDDPASDDGAKEIPVAVLPGGGASSVPSDTCDASADEDAIEAYYSVAGEETTITPRASLRCWPATKARSLTIVRLDDGRIIRSFRAAVGDYPTSLASLVGTLQPLHSPITGHPAAFPGGTGAIADRVYVGDADGVLWRVDLSSTDPSQWTMKRFFDAYTGKQPLDGQMIVTAPVVSTDGAGDITVAFSTGDQEARGAAPDMLTYAWSLKEKLAPGESKPRVEALWSQEFTEGERVTGPIQLFNGALYFSSFQPQLSASTCGTGQSRIWGMDYLERKTDSDLGSGGRARLPEDQSASELVQFIDSSSDLIEDGASIFGVSVAQVVNCYDDDDVDDSFFGSGQHTKVSNIRPGEFQLVMHASKVAGGNTTGGSAPVTTLPLPTPPNAAIMESWAAIVD